MLGACSRPVIAVDWSDLDGAKRHFLLRASLIIQGRALTLYEEVHTLATKEKRRTHGLFLRQLQGIVGVDTRAILLTDAGFRTPWFRQVLALGWDYVGRIRNRHLVRVSEQAPWFDAKALYAKATPQPKELGEVELTRAQPLHCRLVVVRRPKQGRSKWTLSGERAHSGHSERHADGRVSRGYWSPRCQHTRSVQNVSCVCMPNACKSRRRSETSKASVSAWASKCRAPPTPPYCRSITHRDADVTAGLGSSERALSYWANIDVIKPTPSDVAESCPPPTSAGARYTTPDYTSPSSSSPLPNTSPRWCIMRSITANFVGILGQIHLS